MRKAPTAIASCCFVDRPERAAAVFPVPRILPRFSRDLALAWSGDVLWLAAAGGGKPVRMPAFVAVTTADRRVIAVGEEARRMAGHEPGHVAVVRLSDPVTVRDDPGLLTEALRALLREAGGRSRRKPRVVFVAEAGARLASKAAILEAGARDVLFLDPAMAAAIGIGLRVEEPVPRAVLVLERHACSFAVITLAGVAAGFAAPQGIGRLLEDIALHTLATQQVALDVERLDESVRQSGLAGTEAIGWETWINEVATGRAVAASLAGPDVHRISQPFQHWLAWQHRRAFETIPPARRLELATASVYLVGSYARSAGMKELVGAALHRTVIVPEPSDSCLVLGARTVLADVAFLLRYASHESARA